MFSGALKNGDAHVVFNTNDQPKPLFFLETTGTIASGDNAEGRCFDGTWWQMCTRAGSLSRVYWALAVKCWLVG